MQDTQLTSDVNEESLPIDPVPVLSDSLTNNPRVERVIAMESEIRNQREQLRLRSEQIRQEQEYINQRMDLSVDDNLHEIKAEQKYSEEFEARIRSQVYQLHGISDDKVEGMQKYRSAWYQGAAFAMFLMSLILFAFSVYLHGIRAELTVFIAFYIAVEGTLLANEKRENTVGRIFLKGIYFLLFPAIVIIFTCYELKMPEYEMILPVLIIAGVVILVLGVLSFFFYDPYREDRKKRKKAEKYLRNLEKDALKSVRMKEKVMDRQEKSRIRKEVRAKKRTERKEKWTRLLKRKDDLSNADAS